MNKQLNILLAEDDPSNQLLIQKMLNMAGHKVIIANNGQEALTYLDDGPYDVCIFDMQMPVMTGIEAVVEYKNKNINSDLPFIMLTGHTDKEIIEQCKSAGANLYLTKPIASTVLIEAIENLLNTNNVVQNEPGLIIDITQLHNYQDKDFLDEFINIFESSADKLEKELSNSLENNFENFKKVVHSIKGLSGNIGAQVLRNAATEAEGITATEYSNNANLYYRKIIDELLRTRVELLKHSSKSR